MMNEDRTRLDIVPICVLYDLLFLLNLVAFNL